MKIRVEGYSPERFLNLCSIHEILIWDLKNCENAYEMYMSVKGFRQLLPIVRKTKTKVRIIRRCGMPFLLHKYRKRKIFFAGIIISTFLIYVLSLFIWDVDFQGNRSRTNRELMNFLEENNLHHGMMKKDIDCEEVETLIRNHYDDIIWASVEMKGTRLIINVQEGLKIENNGNTLSEEPTDICAAKAGTIESIITRSGTPLVSVGDEVSKGAILVQGRMDIVGDNGEIVNYQYCTADADIYIRTEYDYADSFPRKHMEKEYLGKPDSTYYVKTFSKEWKLNFWNQGENMKYDKKVEEKQLHLWNNFYLPFYWKTVTKDYYKEVEKTYTKEEAKQVAMDHLEQFCKDLTKKGVQIIENNVTIQIDENRCKASGSLLVVEKTGVKQPTKILTIPSQEEADEYNGTHT